MSILEWPAAIRSVGLDAREVNNFRTNDRGRPMPKNPASVFWHHDASPKGASPGALDWIISAYNSGQPSAQIWVNYDGVWFFVGSGYASHAGVVRGSLTSANSIGVETDHTVNEPMSPKLLASLQLGFAAICLKENRNADFVTFHKIEASPEGRKEDPYFEGGDKSDRRLWVPQLNAQRGIIQANMDRIRQGNPTPVRDDFWYQWGWAS